MTIHFFLRGLIVGFSIAAPVGPIGLLCIRRTAAYGRASGFVSGLGAATADAFYGAVAAFGLTAVSNVLTAQRFQLRLIGGLFLCWLGYRTFHARAADRSAAVGEDGLAKAYISTLFLTLTNPTTILSFVAVFAGLGLANASGDRASAASMVAGVFLGSAAWWLILSGVVAVLRDRLGNRELAWVNRASGAVLFGFGCAALWPRISALL
jgi:threonine/homoserine/homoserine lactone efflux protein